MSVVFMALCLISRWFAQISSRKAGLCPCDYGPTPATAASGTPAAVEIDACRPLPTAAFSAAMPAPALVLPQPVVHDSASSGLVCVIDDEASVRQCLSRLFRSAGQPVVTFASAAEFLGQPPHPGPCCLVLDVRMPEQDGFGLQREIQGRTEQIVFLSGHGDVPLCARAFKSGAVDFLTKPVDDEVLLAAVARALDRSSALREARGLRESALARFSRLTRREAAVMERVVAGMLNKQIAADLGIAEKTVKVHRGRMMRKAGVVSVPDLVRLTLAAGYPPSATMANEETPP
jgi:FixJ family two-component response regulator